MRLRIFFVLLLFSTFSLISKELKIEHKLSLRAYLMEDQRIFWSGLERSFGVEGKLILNFSKIKDKRGFFSTLEIFLNQPYGKNILTDNERKKYAQSFKVNTFEISRLTIGYKTKSFTIKLGKDYSPFGRIYYPIFFNNYRFSSPFIRSEAILLKETGIFLSYNPSFISIDFAIVNGEENRDTNSFKAGIIRAGLNFPFFKLGVSLKAHDGIGSEQQKVYKNHLGADLFIKINKVSLSGEFIYDQYGFHKEFDDSEIFWPTSFYYRDIFYKYNTPIEGMGGYLNLKIGENNNLLNLSYGEYHPKKIGNPYHDQNIKRFILKGSKKLNKYLLFFITGIIENEREFKEPWRKGEKGYAFSVGMEFNYE